jgi:small GTP-binding protein
MERRYDYSLKVVVVGDSGVGKTSFLCRFVHHTFEEDAPPTLGVEFHSKIVYSDDRSIQLQLWDTAGQELFRSVTRGYYRGAAAGLILFDLTSRDSFDSVKVWVRDIRSVARPDVILVLIGNKSDLPGRALDAAEATAFAEHNNMQYFETSAKTGSNVSTSVNSIVGLIEKKVCTGDYTLEVPAKLPPATPESNTCGC